MTESCFLSSRDLELSAAFPLREPCFGEAGGRLEEELDDDVDDDDDDADEDKLDEVLVSEP